MIYNRNQLNYVNIAAKPEYFITVSRLTSHIFKQIVVDLRVEAAHLRGCVGFGGDSPQWHTAAFAALIVTQVLSLLGLH